MTLVVFFAVENYFRATSLSLLAQIFEVFISNLNFKKKQRKSSFKTICDATPRNGTEVGKIWF